ncbi:hypothetical protein AGMMS49921_05170 [Endomicrobiia bacterium]|nr:hypothetical protein AGMMS49921_05170 [Endomicrobiia bacterium]
MEDLEEVYIAKQRPDDIDSGKQRLFLGKLKKNVIDLLITNIQKYNRSTMKQKKKAVRSDVMD